MMDEKIVLRKSVIVFLVGLVIFSIIGIFAKTVSYPLGFIVGYIASMLSFGIIIKMSEIILNLRQSTMIVVVMFVVKMAIYAISFLLAIFFKDIFNIIGVFFGLMVTRITIYVVTYLTKGGEVSE